MNGPNRFQKVGRRASVHEYDFQIPPSEFCRQQVEKLEQEEGPLGKHLESMFAGLAANICDDTIEIGLSANDATYNIDFTVQHLKGASESKEARSKCVGDYIVNTMRQYQNEHLCKFIGAGISDYLYEEICPELPSRIWLELDVVPMIFVVGKDYNVGFTGHRVDELADSMARKCIMMFGPSQQPRIDVGFRNEVGVDATGHAMITRLENYKGTVGERTWNGVMNYVKELNGRKTKIAFFNSTPQGGGVALMRHALVRFLRLLNVDIKWYVPRPRPAVFRITKTNHNILQGVNDPGEYLSKEHGKLITEWITENAERYWLRDGGPMSPRSKGGADVIMIDDPQMPGLIPLCKKADPERKVIYRSHIQIRSDLVAEKDSAARGVWDYLWNDIQHADLFISHPVPIFVPDGIPPEIVAFMPATTDWLDGLNKNLDPWAWAYQIHGYNVECDSRKMAKLNYPARDYIIQVARFDPAKGIPDVVESYGKLRHKYLKDVPAEQTPQLVICGHGAIDDPDAQRIYDQTMYHIESKYPDLKDDISVMRLAPIDQELNALLSGAKVAMQLSTREGFEVKVSEAIHKGIPTIATLAGGIPLQVQHEKNGFLVKPGDSDAVAKHLYDLLTDEKLYKRMSEYATHSVSDEVSTVGNALCWTYLAVKSAEGKDIKPNGRWIFDMAREECGQKWVDGETRLPRKGIT